MDDLAYEELFAATAGLGNWHEVNGKEQYLANRDECLSCLRDLQIALKQDGPETGCEVRLKLGEWKVLSNHLVPLFTSYREDAEISASVLKLMVTLTTRVGLHGSGQLQHLHHLQDYKDSFAKKDVFIILMGLLVETMEEDEDAEGEARPNRQEVFKAVLTLLCNLISVRDPSPGDAGFTPLRKNLQLQYIRHFHDEGVLDFFLLFAEGIAAEQGGDEQQAWHLADILYHICTHVDPEELMQSRKEKNKRELADLLDRDKMDSKARAPQSSRHSRFGTSMQSVNADGTVAVTTSVMHTEAISKGGQLWRREYRNTPGSEKKANMFHDPFFVDLEEGSVRDHNQLNPHVRGSLEDGKNHGDAVLSGLRKFFEEFVQTSFSTLVSIMRSSSSSTKADGPMVGTEFNRPHLLNFLSWFLEFHRHLHGLQVAKAKKSREQPPVIDIASIQGAIDLDMIQFTTARLREYGKESNIHASMLVIVLRALSQQIKTINVVTESSDSDTRDCGDILVQNIIKDDVMAHLSWIMKNFKSSSHDPRILSYTVEIFHNMIRLMTRVGEREGKRQVEFQVERARRGANFTRSTTTTEKEVAGLADARVVENLFHLLEKYRRHSAQLHSMLVKLIYQIVRAQPTNIVIFFELSYFMRIFRLMTDPQLSGGKSKKYQEMVSLLQFILRQFFKCAEINGMVFAELLFRKVQENPREALLESHASEFAAILDNYEDESYKRILERMGAGETLGAMRLKQRAILKGQLPWTDEEDKVLQERYAMYADHPLCAELLAAELPEESRRTAQQVRKRLAELGLIAVRGAGKSAPGGATEQDEDDLDPPTKKAKVMELEVPGTALDAETGDVPASPGTPRNDAAQEEVEMMEDELERLLDAAYDTFPGEAGGAASSTMGAGPAATAGISQTMDLEKELEAFLDEEPEGPASAAASLSQAVPDSLELDLERLMDEAPTPARAARSSAGGASAASAGEPGPSQAGPDSLERDLERLMDEAPTASSGSTQAARVSTAGGSEGPASQPGASQAGLSQTGPDSLELDLERLMDEAPTAASASSQRARASTGGASDVAASQMRASQGSSSQTGPDSLELDLERLMDEAPTAASGSTQGARASTGGASDVSASQTRASQGMSQSGPDSLERDLERLMDESQ